MWLLGVLTLAFAGSFAAAIVMGDWEGRAQAARGFAGPDGLLARMPAMRVAASSFGVSAPVRR